MKTPQQIRNEVEKEDLTKRGTIRKIRYRNKMEIKTAECNHKCPLCCNDEGVRAIIREEIVMFVVKCSVVICGIVGIMMLGGAIL